MPRKPPPLRQLLIWVGSPALAAFLAAPCAAWGWLGHQVAGDIAQRYLSPTARAAVQHILGAETLAEASLWADRMRDDPSTFWQEVAGPYHYVTVPPEQRYRDVGAPPEGDAVTALAQFAADLQSPVSSGAERRLALRFALHIVQDLHQPLHVGNGRDRGGNDVTVRFDGDVLNLHRVWDATIPDSAGRTRAQWATALEQRGLLRPPRDGDADPLRWIAESGALRDTLYPPPQRIDAAYLAAALPTAEERIALAGIRAAAWFNAVFDDAALTR
jgi:hypothetical protein